MAASHKISDVLSAIKRASTGSLATFAIYAAFVARHLTTGAPPQSLVHHLCEIASTVEDVGALVNVLHDTISATRWEDVDLAIASTSGNTGVPTQVSARAILGKCHDWRTLIKICRALAECS